MSDSLLQNKHFCILPWVHMHSWPSGKVYACGVGDPSQEPLGDLQKQSINEVWNSEKFRELRLKMLADKPNAFCERCFELERSGVTTVRQIVNNKFKHRVGKALATAPDGNAGPTQLAFLDFRYSNLCNLRCRSCGPQLSSSWYKDSVALNGPLDHLPLLTARANPISLWEELEPLLDDVEEAYFAGGEPLIMEEHYKILDHWIHQGRTNVRLGYTTNFTQMDFKGKSIFDYWNQFPTVSVGASLDGNHRRGEYLRKNLKWHQVVENRRQMMKECPHVSFEIAFTASMYNVFNLPDFHREWVELGLIEVQQFRVNMLLEPQNMRSQMLPMFLKARVRRRYEEHIKWLETFPADQVKGAIESFRQILQLMEEKDLSHLVDSWLRKTQSVDRLRGENVFSVFPELLEIKYYQSQTEGSVLL